MDFSYQGMLMKKRMVREDLAEVFTARSTVQITVTEGEFRPYRVRDVDGMDAAYYATPAEAFEMAKRELYHSEMAKRKVPENPKEALQRLIDLTSDG